MSLRAGGKDEFGLLGLLLLFISSTSSDCYDTSPSFSAELAENAAK
ncbi:hypothetical protein CAter10_2206 [Collimonas arenae]|nr:hypothetical protein CAter10_2206 [Collimonas arenae]